MCRSSFGVLGDPSVELAVVDPGYSGTTSVDFEEPNFEPFLLGITQDN